MATMLETIPCERCEIQINLQDWTEHVVSNSVLVYLDLYLTLCREIVLMEPINEQRETKGKEIIHNFVHFFVFLEILRMMNLK